MYLQCLLLIKFPAKGSEPMNPADLQKDVDQFLKVIIGLMTALVLALWTWTVVISVRIEVAGLQHAGEVPESSVSLSDLSDENIEARCRALDDAMQKMLEKLSAEVGDDPTWDSILPANNCYSKSGVIQPNMLTCEQLAGASVKAHAEVGGSSCQPTVIADDAEVVGVIVEGQPKAFLIDALSCENGWLVNCVYGYYPLSVIYSSREDAVSVYTTKKQHCPIPLRRGGRTVDDHPILLLDDYRFVFGDRHESFRDVEFQRTTLANWMRNHPTTALYIGEQPQEDSQEDDSDVMHMFEYALR